MPSVLNDWVHDLTYMQQSVLLAMVRNADGISKHHPQKELIKWFRRCILKSAFDGRHLTIPQEPGGGSFTGPVPDIERALDSFIWARDEMTLHYFAHSMHAFEILGYKYPHAFYRAFWHRAYIRCVEAMHMRPETEADMDRRLCDNPETWMEREDKCGGCSSTERKDHPLDEDSESVTPLFATAEPMDAELARLAPGQGDQGYPEPNTAPRPTFAATRDDHFVNIQTGLLLGHEFDLKWSHRFDEFPVYVEPPLVQPGPNKRTRDNLGASDYDG